MKVLFAVNNDKVSESIIKRFQRDYKEIISSKNVYYFNAILKELQKDKSYDRIIISEDLEPFSNNNYEAIDKFIFDKLDKISDEAFNSEGANIPIILIGTDRRTRPEPLLIKLFGIGVYDTLVGQDRSVEKVCELLNKPRSKKEAKVYYKIDSDDVEYKPENENDVSEAEIQNILAHYKKLGKDEEKYVESFERIAVQYTDEQLKLIITFLPKNVTYVLENNSPKYRQVMGMNPKTIRKENKKFSVKNEEAQKIEFIEKELNKQRLSKPVIIPTSVDTNKVKRIVDKKREEERIRKVPHTTHTLDENYERHERKIVKKPRHEEIEDFEDVEDVVEPVKRGRGRPPKKKTESEIQDKTKVAEPVKRGRGRPPKKKVEDEVENETKVVSPVKRGRGRPPKKKIEDEDVDILPGFDDFEDLEDEDKKIPTPKVKKDEDVTLPGFNDYDDEEDEDDDDISVPMADDDDDYYEEEDNTKSNYSAPISNPNFNRMEPISKQNSKEIESANKYNSSVNFNIDNLISSDQKIVSFVGTSKNGTSFLVSNLAQMFSEKGISTAILDLTKNRNAYYMYTDNNPELTGAAYNCIENLRRGIAEGIPINKNLTIYTSLPDEVEGLKDYENIVETLLNNYSLVLLDCDFDTEYEYFNVVQEIYLVQSLDVLTIQPLTAFLRELKAKDVLDPNKIRIVINKHVRLNKMSDKMLIEGMSSYNDPSMSFMTELFNSNNVKYTIIPFDQQAYTKYLDSLVDCKFSLRGYSKNMLQSLNKLGNMVFPLINNKPVKEKNNKYNNYNNNFSTGTSNTLNKMKKKY